MYSGELRVVEVIKVEPEDIDADRKLIRIKVSKGRKTGTLCFPMLPLQIL